MLLLIKVFIVTNLAALYGRFFLLEGKMENIMIIPAKTMPIVTYCKVFGLTAEQINMRLNRGIWQKGVHVLSVDGSKERFIDLEEVDKWARKNKIHVA